jgi:hypothetical protein
MNTEQNNNKYQNGKIYTIRSYTTDKYYIGSTTQPLPKRLYEHKKHYITHLAGKQNFITSYEIIKNNDCYIELLELFPCNSKMELEKREGELIREHLDNVVNKYVAGRTLKEYYSDNRNAILEKKKNYNEENKDKIKQYYEDNKEHFMKYYYDNKDIICQKKKVKISCECGAVLRKAGFNRHSKSKIHQNFISQKFT